MTTSNLATRHGFESFRGFTVGRGGRRIDRIVIHHQAGTNFNAILNSFASGQTSYHYGVSQTGQIHAYVSENNTAWHAGNWDMNQRSIGICHTNITGAPHWSVADSSLRASARLIADICRRHGITPSNTTIIPHRVVVATACPGGLNIGLLIQYVREEMNQNTEGDIEMIVEVRHNGRAALFACNGTHCRHIQNISTVQTYQAGGMRQVRARNDAEFIREWGLANHAAFR